MDRYGGFIAHGPFVLYHDLLTRWVWKPGSPQAELLCKGASAEWSGSFSGRTIWIVVEGPNYDACESYVTAIPSTPTYLKYQLTHLTCTILRHNCRCREQCCIPMYPSQIHGTNNCLYHTSSNIIIWRLLSVRYLDYKRLKLLNVYLRPKNPDHNNQLYMLNPSEIYMR